MRCCYSIKKIEGEDADTDEDRVGALGCSSGRVGWREGVSELPKSSEWIPGV